MMAKCIVLLSILFFIVTITNAQVPVINSFIPANGAVGTVVDITGNNFAPNATGNVVYFGAAKASIISSTSTQLVVSVPFGANCDPITVTVNGLTAYSESPFIVTFIGPIYTLGFFNSKIDISSGNFVYGVAIKDLDGDGKPDIVVVNSGSNDVSFIKNNSQPGVLGFTVAVRKGVNNYSTGVAIGDLDGDGKPDVVVTNFNANTISVFKNTSVNNQLSFDNAIVFTTGTNPYNVAIADFNGDGKPDIAVTNENSYPSTISVFTNTTISGGSITFLPKIDFTAPYSARGISVADMDLDGKSDIVVASQSGVVSVLKNTSTISNINFAAKTDYSMPSGSSPESVVISDLDGDLKPDIAVANNNTPGTISILKNNSSSGNMSFLARQDFPTGLNPFSICAGDINGDGKPDIAVVNQVDNTVSVLVNSSSAGHVNFYSRIDYPTGNYPRSALIDDIDGSGKPDLVIGNNSASTISILLANTQKIQAVITFPPPVTINIGANNILYPGATSNNTQIPITYTSSNPGVAYLGMDGLLHLIAPGVTVITASQSGDNNYNPAVSVSETFTIMQDQLIQFPVITAKTTCDVDFAAAAISSNPNIPLTYFSSNPSTATISSAGIIHILGVGNTTITVSQSGNSLYNTALPQSQTLIVSASAAPIVTIIPDHTSICSGMPVTFTALVSNGGTNVTYQWQLNGVNTGTNSATFTTTLATSDAVECFVTNSCQIVGASNFYVGEIVNTYVTPSVIISSSATTSICNGKSVTFIAVPTNGGINPTYQWQVNGNNAGTNSAIFTSSTLADGDMVTCIFTNNTGLCLTMATALSNTIKVGVVTPVNPLPSITIISSANNVYAGTNIIITAIVANAGTINNYQWQVNGLLVGSNNQTYNSNKFKNGDIISCTITSSIACSAPVTSAGLTLTLLPPPIIIIPNAFTPNGDGINDTWSIASLLSYPDCLINIYNRNGMLVFHSKGYAIPWDGLLKGKPLPPSTYYYIIKASTKSENLSGYVTLTR
jgi:gliding motility-associated-like protein